MALSRYGLPQHPFDYAEPLDVPPLTLTHYLSVEGFGDQRPLIDKWAQGTITKPQFFLIHGVSGTGRTSVANYIICQFCHQRQREPFRVIEAINDDYYEKSLHNWMMNLIFKSDGALKTKLLGYFSGITVGSPEAQYADFLKQAVAELKAQNNKSLMAVFDNVVKQELFGLAQGIFDSQNIPLPDIPLVIFTTSKPTVAAAFQNLNRRPAGLAPIELRYLSGHDVLELIEQRWDGLQATKPIPFDTMAVVRAFGSRKYPLRSVIEALKYIFDQKLQSLPPGGDWPNDPSLQITSSEIAMTLLELRLPTVDNSP